MTPPAPETPPPPRRSRGLRTFIGCLVGFAALALVLAGGLRWGLANLHQPTLKAWIQESLVERYGVELDYSRLSVAPLSSLQLEGLSVQTPEALRAHTPQLLSLAEARIVWDGWGLLNRRLSIAEISLRGLHLALVIDEDGQSSVTLLAQGFGPAADAPPPPSTPAPEAAPLSHGLALPPLPVEIELAQVRLEDLRLSVFQLEAGLLRRRLEIEGLEARANAQLGAGPPKLRFDLRSPEAAPGLKVQITDFNGEQERNRRLLASFVHSFQIHDSTRLEAVLELAVKEQSFDPSLALSGPLAKLESSVHFRAEDGLTHIEVPRISMLGEAIHGKWIFDLLDSEGPLPAPVIREGELHVALDPLLAIYPISMPGTSLSQVELDLGIQEMALDTDSWLPTKGSVKAGARLGSARWQQGGQEAKLSKGRFELDARVLGPLELDVTSRMAADGLDYVGPGIRSQVQGLSASLEANGLKIALADPLRSIGSLGLQGTIRAVEAHTPSGQISGRDSSFKGSTAVSGTPPYAFESRVEVAAFSLRSPSGELAFHEAPLDLVFNASEVFPDLGSPEQSRGQLSGSLDLPPFNAELQAEKKAATGHWKLSGSAAQLRPLAALLPPEIRRVNRIDWNHLGLSFHSDGSFSGPLNAQALRIDHRSSLAVTGLSLRRPGLNLATRKMSMAFNSRGNQRAHQGELELRVDAPRLNAFSSDQQHSFSAKLDFDLRQPRINLDATTRAPLGPDIAMKLLASFDGKQRSLRYDAEMRLARLQHLAAFIPEKLRKEHQLVWESLRLEAKASGDLGGAIQRFTPQGQPILAEDPLAALRGEQRVQLSLAGLSYKGKELSMELPNTHFESVVLASDEGLATDSKLSLASLDLNAAGQRVVMKDWQQSLKVKVDDPRKPRNMTIGALTQIAQLEQSVAPIYPLGEMKLAAGAKVKDGTQVQISHITYENGAGGTRLQLSGSASLERPIGATADPSASAEATITSPTGLRRLIFEGELMQQLAPLSGDPQRFLGRGSFSVPFSIESGDGRRFRAVASAQAKDVHVSLPPQQASLNGMNGKLSLLQEIEVTPDGKLRVLAGASRNAYSRLSYQDVHPFLSGDSYLSIDQVESKGIVAGPIAGNLRIDRNIVGLEQLQMTFLGGTITGNMMADTRPGDRELRFRGNITGLRPSRTEERLDANAAIVFRPETLELEGRSQILRIGRQHLLDTLDLFDPYREDKNMNATRKALLAGYPKRVRLRFKHGFTAMKVELGGLAGVATISEIRGIPLGPLLQRYLGPYLPSDEDS